MVLQGRPCSCVLEAFESHGRVSATAPRDHGSEPVVLLHQEAKRLTLAPEAGHHVHAETEQCMQVTLVAAASCEEDCCRVQTCPKTNKTKSTAAARGSETR
jgi:hypothetical protein